MEPQPFTRDDLMRLIEMEGGPHVSVFLPKPNSIHEAGQDRIRIGNLIRQARGTLREYWMPETEADEFLEPLRTFANDVELVKPRTFAVALFLSENGFEPFRIDGGGDERWGIGRKFHVRPLLNVLERLDSYAVLTLSQKRTALYEATAERLEQVPVKGLNESFQEYRMSITAQPGSQVHSAAVGVRGKQGAVFHGQGGASDREAAELDHYLKHIDNHVQSYHHRHPHTPLILAGVDSLTSIYRSITHCVSILETSISGNVDHLSTQQLRQSAREITEREQKRRRDQQADRIREHDVPVETNSELILVAATKGRIETLFIDQQAELFGIFDDNGGILKEVKHAPTGDPADVSHDLIEFAATETIKSGGSVYAVKHSEMPVDSRMAASLRF